MRSAVLNPPFLEHWTFFFLDFRFGYLRITPPPQMNFSWRILTLRIRRCVLESYYGLFINCWKEIAVSLKLIVLFKIYQCEDVPKSGNISNGMWPYTVQPNSMQKDSIQIYVSHLHCFILFIEYQLTESESGWIPKAHVKHGRLCT